MWHSREWLCHFFAIRHSVTLIQNRNMDGTSMQENHSRGRLCYTKKEKQKSVAFAGQTVKIKFFTLEPGAFE
ncbi:MAG: hypothetical protein DRP83_05470 [Planctomycetota bacterium]|nr:MAG: hypothetical protein DRP83_05470 [Planctomycetota bacterium]